MAIPIALQLYSVREDCAKDFLGIIAQVAKMGYAGVEFAGYHGHSAKDLRKCLDDNGLVAPSTHTPLSALADDQFGATVELHHTLGAEFVIVPWIPDDMHNSIEACKKTGELFTTFAEKLAPHGLKTGFHSHGGDMRELADGKSAYHHIASSTPSTFVMQYDTANGMSGGADPVQPILDWPGRGATVHLKEWSGEHGAKVIGEGNVPWKAVFDACESVAGTKWYIVEHESYEGMTPMQAVEKCLQNLRGMGK